MDCTVFGGGTLSCMNQATASRLGGMVPPTSALWPTSPKSRVSKDGHPNPQFRSELRVIANFRNAISVLSIYFQALLIIGAVIWIDNLAVYVLGFLLMGRTHAQMLSLMHESAHRLLFSNRKINDFVGRWVLGYVSFVNTDGYRYVHMAHHKDEFGPREPDIPLYANYPISRSSFWRKMRRDISGRTGLRMLKEQFAKPFSKNQSGQRIDLRIIVVQFAILAIVGYLAHPAIYLMFWFLPYLTIWRIMNRLRSIAEHGGMRADPDDRRATTHSVKQHIISSFFLVPFNIGWHLAHHCDAGIPFRSLPKLHAELRKSGYVNDEYEYANYFSIWHALRQG